MKDNAKTTRFVATVFSTGWAIYAVAQAPSPFNMVSTVISAVPALIGFALVAFDKWLWKWPGVNRLTGRPRIGGTWIARITPGPGSRIPPGGNWGPIPAVIVIEQSFWSVHVRLYTAESESLSTTASMIPRGDGSEGQCLASVYQNKPDPAHRDRSPIHEGACNLNFIGRKPATADGNYWTDRLTAGGILIRLIDRKTDRGRLDCMALARQQFNTAH